jgi:hypothetical protein
VERRSRRGAEDPPIKVRKANPDGYITVGIHKSIFYPLNRQRIAESRRLGGLRLSWTDFFRVVMRRLKPKGA